MSTFPAVLCAGAFLGGLLALAGSWSRGARAGRAPHLAVGGVAGLGGATMIRFNGHPVVALLVALAAGAALGWLLHIAEQRLEPGRIPLAADIVGLAVIVSAAGLLAPSPAVLEQRTLLGGGWPDDPGGLLLAVVVAVAGTAAGVLLARAPAAVLPWRLRWVLAGSASALLGAVSVLPAGAVFALARGEPLALALAAAAVAALSPTPTVAVGIGLVAGAVLASAAVAGAPAGLAAGLLLLGAIALRAPRGAAA